MEEEHINAEELFEINLRLPLNTIREDCEREECESSLFSYDFHGEEDCVYVAVGIGNSESSMEALLWTLQHAVSPSTTVHLIHVFPEVRLIPSPMGRLPRNHVNPEFVENYLAQEKGKRRLLLQKFINSCSASKVKVEILLIEGDDVAKAIIKLITNLNIRKLAVGTTKSNLSKVGSRRRNVIAEQILKNAPESCDVKVVCEGTEVIDQILWSVSPRTSNASNIKSTQEEDERYKVVPYKLFRPKMIWLFRPWFL